MGLLAKDKTVSGPNYGSTTFFLKLAYFTYYLSIGCIQSFQSIILRGAGLSNSQLGTVVTIGLVGGMTSPVTIGFIADKTKKSRILLLITSTLNFIFHGAPIIIIFFVRGIGPPKSGASGVPSSVPLPSGQRTHHHTSPQDSLPSMYMLMALSLVQFCATFCDQGSKALMDGLVHKVISEAKKQDFRIDFARLRMYGGVGICLASLISGTLLDYIKKILPTYLPGEMCLVILCFTIGALYVANVAMFVPDAETKATVEFTSAVKNVMKDSTVLVFLVTQFVCQFAMNLTRSYETLYILYLGGTRFLSGLAMSFGYSADVLTMYFSPVICRKLGRAEYTIIMTLSMSFLRSVMFGLADNALLSVNNSFLTGFCIGMYVPTMSVLVKGRAPDHLISSYVSLLTTIGKVGAAISSKVGGNLSDYYGYRSIQFISGGVYLAAALILASYMYFKRFRRQGNINEGEEEFVNDGDIEKSLIINNEENNQKA